MGCEACEEKSKEYQAKLNKAREYGIKQGLQEVVLVRALNNTIAICAPDDPKVRKFPVLDRVWIGKAATV